MANSKKRCTGCRERFPSESVITVPGGVFCTINCAIEYSNKKKLVAAKKKKIAYKKETTRLRSEHRKNDRSFWIKKAQTACNAYIRKRDENLPCVSCGTTKDVQYAAGHWKTRGAHPELAFNEYNLAKQCNQYCNLHRSGAVDDFRAELINRIGIRHVEWIEGHHETQKLTIDDLKDIYNYYREQFKIIKSSGLESL